MVFFGLTFGGFFFGFSGGGFALGGFVFAIEDREDTADFRFIPFLDEDFGQFALIEGLHFHGCFVSFDLGKDIADFDFIADLLVPFDEGSLGHCIREFGHFDFY